MKDVAWGWMIVSRRSGGGVYWADDEGRQALQIVLGARRERHKETRTMRVCLDFGVPADLAACVAELSAGGLKFAVPSDRLADAAAALRSAAPYGPPGLGTVSFVTGASVRYVVSGARRDALLAEPRLCNIPRRPSCTG